jgi:hypothetical protein
MHPIIDNNSLPYDLVKHYIFPFLQKEVVKNVVKGLIMLEVQSNVAKVLKFS